MFPRIEIERWKYSSRYHVYVSSFGRIKLSRRGTDLPVCKAYYPCVKIGEKLISIHRLVLATFKPTTGMENLTVDHIDRNHDNARLSNLRWMTKKDNIDAANEADIDLNELKKLKLSLAKGNKVRETLQYHCDCLERDYNNLVRENKKLLEKIRDIDNVGLDDGQSKCVKNEPQPAATR